MTRCPAQYYEGLWRRRFQRPGSVCIISDVSLSCNAACRLMLLRCRDGRRGPWLETASGIFGLMSLYCALIDA